MTNPVILRLNFHPESQDLNSGTAFHNNNNELDPISSRSLNKNTNMNVTNHI